MTAVAGVLLFAAGLAAGWLARPMPPEPRPAVVFERVADPTTQENFDRLLDTLVK